MTLRDVIARRIRSAGPLPFADYMDTALYHPQLGYYTRSARRSGAGGDFLTSVDCGPVFGTLLARQLDEMHDLLGAAATPFDLVEAGAGNGRLARSILDAAEAGHPALYAALRLTLVERSAAARARHTDTLGRHADKLERSADTVPPGINGVVVANELLDALPVHALAMTGEGLREVFVDLDERAPNCFVERLGPPSQAVRAHCDRFGIALRPGWRAEVSPAMVRWVEHTAERLRRGFLLLVDYGHEATELYSASHAQGTLTTYRAHVQEGGAQAAGHPPWLADPGAADLTAHVDLTALRLAAEETGLETLAVVDQTYFLLGLGAGETTGLDGDLAALRERLALKTLLVPGGLGSTHKVLIFGKLVGRPPLRGTAFSRRATR